MQGTHKSFKTGSQNDKILKHLQSGKSLTCLEAIQLKYSHNLRSRIADLKRSGYDVKSEQVNIDGGFIAKYSLEQIHEEHYRQKDELRREMRNMYKDKS